MVYGMVTTMAAVGWSHPIAAILWDLSALVVAIRRLAAHVDRGLLAVLETDDMAGGLMDPVPEALQQPAMLFAARQFYQQAK